MAVASCELIVQLLAMRRLNFDVNFIKKQFKLINPLKNQRNVPVHPNEDIKDPLPVISGLLLDPLNDKVKVKLLDACQFEHQLFQAHVVAVVLVQDLKKGMLICLVKLKVLCAAEIRN